MILFKRLRWKNLLSTGNHFTEILLNGNPNTLIVGTNGSGKSTMLDALCFGLFGKPFRGINKPNLLNSINGRDCVVEIEFSIGPSEYIVKRGMKPNVFEIWQNGQMINQDAAAKDYQKVLEQQILRLNYKTFTQVVILGSASFVPFMQLPAHQRREVIEDILDIRIFSTMNQLLKERAQTTKDEMLRIEGSINTLKERVSAQKKLIATITEARASTTENLEDKIAKTLVEIQTATTKQEALAVEVEALIESVSSESDLKADKRKAAAAKQKVETRMESVHEQIRFLQESDDCPSCKQKIPHTHKESTILQANDDLKKYEDEQKILESCLEKLTSKLEKITDINSVLTKKNIELSTVNNTISLLNKHIADYRHEIESHHSDTSNLDEEKTKLKDIAEKAMEMLDIKTTLAERKNLQDIASLLLKDTGIKTAIIREYLPVMNKLINKYLNIMDSFIHFELDENFNEVIKSRFRDEFTYASFSEGEKQRIDLSILFTWRQIAKMKNSVNTNLLIFDEIMDSSLDAAGTESFMSLLDTFGLETNIFVISHKGDQLFDKFHSVIRIEKKNDFSTIA